MTEHEIERLVVRLVGDSASYRKMLQDAEKQATEAAKTIEDAGKKIEAVKSRLEKFSLGISTFGRGLQSWGRSMSLYVTAPIIALGTAAIKAGSDFQSGFAGVRKTVNATEAEFATLRQGFKDMAATTPIPVTDLLKIGELGGQLGIATDKLLNFTRVIAMVGVTSNLTVEEAADEFAQFINITGLSQDKVENLGSAVTALGSSMAASERGIMSMGMRLAAAGTTIGITVPQIIGFASSLASVGIEAEAGGTAFSKLFLMIGQSVALGNDALTQFAKVAGKSVAEFSRLFREDAAGAVMALLKGLNKLSPDDKILALKDLGLDESTRMIDAVLRASNAVDLFGKALSDSKTAFDENTALAKEAAERFKTFESAMIKLWNNVKLFGEELFTVLEPSLRAIIASVKDLTDWFRQLSPEMKMQLASTLALAAAFGPLLVIVGMLVSSGGSLVGAIGSMIVAFQAVTTQVGLAKLAFLEFSIVVGVTAVAAIVLWSQELYRANQDLKDFNNEMEKSKKLQSELLSRQATGTAGLLSKAAGIEDDTSRKSFLADALREAQQEVKGYENAVKGAESNVDALDAWWKRWTGNKVLAAANDELKEQQNLLDGAKKLVEQLNTEYRKLAGPTLQDQSPSKARLDFFSGTSSRQTEAQKELAKDAKQLTDKLQAQVQTFGLSSNEAQIYALRLKGVSMAELEAASAAARFLDNQEAQKKLFERAAEIKKDIMTPLEKFAEAQKELDALFLDNKLNADEYQKAMGKIKKELDDAGKAAQTAAGRFDAAAVGSSEAISRMMDFQAGKGRGGGMSKFKLPEKPDLGPALTEFEKMNREPFPKGPVSGVQRMVAEGSAAGGTLDEGLFATLHGFDPGRTLKRITGSDNPDVAGYATGGVDTDRVYDSTGGDDGMHVTTRPNTATGNETQITLVEMAVALNRLVEIAEIEAAKPGLEDVEAGALTN